MPPRILIVEDDPEVRANIRDVLARQGHQALESASLSEAFARDDWTDFRAIVLSRHSPDSQAESALPRLKLCAPGVPVIVLIEFPDAESAARALQSGAYDFVYNPIDADVLRASLGRIAELQDLHASRNAEVLARQLSESRSDLLTEAIACMGEGILITGDNLDWPGPKIVFVNEALCRITGYSAEELIGETPRILQGGGTDAATLERMRAELAAGHSCTAQLTNYRKDGTPYQAEVFITALSIGAGDRKNFVAIHRDITKQKKTEVELREAHRHLETVVETAPTLMIVTDRQRRIVLFNRACEELTGYRRQEVLGQTIMERFHSPELLAAIERYDKEPEATGPCPPQEFTWTTRSGEQRLIEWRCTRLPNETGEDWQILGIGVDVTERRLAERDRARLAAIVESSGDAIIGVSLTGKVESWNRAAEQMFGYARGEIMGRPIALLSPLDRLGESAELLRRISSGEQVDHFETARVRKDGEKLDVSLTVSPVRDAGGRITAVSKIARDVTDRKRNELAVRQSEERTQAVLASLQARIAVLDKLGVITAVNPAWDSFCRENNGDQTRCSIGANYLETCRDAAAMGEHDALHVARSVRKVLNGSLEAFQYEYPCHSPSGRHWFLLQATPLRDGKGGAVVSHSDITSRVHAERRLRDSEERLRAILNTASDAVLNTDSEEIIIDANPSAERLFGFPSAELLGRNVRTLFAPPHRDDAQLGRLFRRNVVVSVASAHEVVGLRRDGTTFPAEIAVNEVDHLGLFTAVVRDITERKNLEQHIHEATSAEQRRIGHELHDGTGQELTGLSLFAAALIETLNEAQPLGEGWKLDEPRFQRIRTTANRLAQGLNEAHQHVQKLSRGIMPVHVDVEGLRSALAELASAIDARETISCQFDYTDAVRVADNSVALNLYRIAQEAVSNALRHGQAKRIHICLRGDGDGDDIILEVADNGIGFDPAKIDKGMGLRTMEYRAGLVGGVLHVARNPDGGTTVRCTLSGAKA
jgi:PAS domain S-box-containing protein